MAILKLPDDARCRECGYALRGLTTETCPECGRDFDAANRATFRMPDEPSLPVAMIREISRSLGRPRRRLNHFGTATITLAALLVALTGIDTVRWNDGTPAGSLLWIFWLAIASRVAFATRWRTNRRAPRHWRTATITLLFFAILIPMLLARRAYSCPHGTVVMFGRVGFARSTVGGPCRNAMPSRSAWPIGRDLYFVLD